MRIELLSSLLIYRRAVVLGALAVVSAAAWAYLLLSGGIQVEMMETGDGQMMAMLPRWNLPYAVLMAVIWVVMMMAMMLPSAAPTVLLVTALTGDRLGNSNLIPATAMLFASGYLLVWCGFSIAATLLQWGLDNVGLLSQSMAFANATLASTVLIAAGAYQSTPLKDACIRHCRSPTEFVIRHWRGGALGAVSIGVRHGLFCLGCCWMLMALLFVGGLMNLAWVGAIALLVFLEKTAPRGDWMSRFTGLLLTGWGAADLITLVMK